jgi:hypothetical protein
VRFSNECCWPKDFTVGPRRELPKFLFRLEPKPSRVTVQTLPDVRGHVLVEEIDPPEEGRKPFSGSADIGSPVTISFKDDSDMSKTLRFTVFVAGRDDPLKKQIVIRPAENRPITIKLD